MPRSVFYLGGHTLAQFAHLANRRHHHVGVVLDLHVAAHPAVLKEFLSGQHFVGLAQFVFKQPYFNTLKNGDSAYTYRCRRNGVQHLGSNGENDGRRKKKRVVARNPNSRRPSFSLNHPAARTPGRNTSRSTDWCCPRPTPSGRRTNRATSGTASATGRRPIRQQPPNAPLPSTPKALKATPPKQVRSSPRSVRTSSKRGEIDEKEMKLNAHANLWEKYRPDKSQSKPF